MSKIDLSVIIPVYNENATLEELLKRVKASSVVKEIVIIDDFSTDGSRETLKSLKDPVVKVFFQPENKGKGAAIKLGLENVTGNYCLVQDADLEYDPKDYSRLVEALNGETEVIFGSRFQNQRPQMMKHSYYANMLLTALTNLLFTANLTDMASCYKLIPTKILRGLDLKSNRFEIELEITAKLLTKKVKIKEIPISFVGRSYNQGKKITWWDGIKDLWLLFKFRLLGFN